MRRHKRLLLGAVTIFVLTFPAAAQTYEVLYAFTGTNGDGATPLGKLLPVGTDFYGTTNSVVTSAGCASRAAAPSFGSTHRTR